MNRIKRTNFSADSLLHLVERVGNALPHPASLFALFSLLVIIISAIARALDLSAVHPATGETIHVFSLLSVAGLHRILTEMIHNFTAFAPLGTVLVSMLGIGIAEGSGLIGAALRLLVLRAPKHLLTFVLVFTGVLSNTASEVGYVLLVPLGAVIFMAAGRHPIAGLAAAFAGVSGGYSANLFLGTLDPLLAGLSEEAAHIIDPSYFVNPAANYYFMVVSTFLVTLLGTWVTEKFVVPRLGDYHGHTSDTELRPLKREEKRGLVFAGIASLIFLAVIAAGIVPQNGFLRNLQSGGILDSPFLKGIVAFIFLGAATAGISYGIGAGTIKSDKDVMRGMGKSIETLSIYIVLTFFAAQFVAYFRWTHLGLIFAIRGADLIQSSGLGAIPLMLVFILLSAFINLFMGSASAKWAIMAPVFIPMFMLLGYSPELVQVTYRIGDSVTNIISPMMSYFALIVAFVERYNPKAGIGTVIAVMLPYTVVFFIGWSILLVLWLLLGLPVGPGAALYL
ncbi:AbgT family transporter [candidate division KSB1 bacterium]|nr:AbgT family transporter [candidate division KSB1 bacterium]